jgi:hypothetical protein
VGASISERRGGSGRNVTMPARQYRISGERRSFALLRPIADSTGQDNLRQTIPAAHAEFEEQQAIAS